ncbi:MAG: hypothetical protein WCE30_27030 [Mycobacterium sp.]
MGVGAPQLQLTTDHHCQPAQWYDLLGGLGYLFCQYGETASHVGTMLSGLATALALFLGGIWAYAKFIRGRTFQPRTSVDASGQWYELADVGDVLQIRIRVKNIGGAKLTLVNDDTYMEVFVPGVGHATTPAERRTDRWWPDVRWKSVPELVDAKPITTRKFWIFQDHDFIEPGESVFNDRLLNLGQEQSVVRIVARITWEVRHWYGRGRVRPDKWPARLWWPTASVVFDIVDQILPPGTTIYGTSSDQSTRQEVAK